MFQHRRTVKSQGLLPKLTLFIAHMGNSHFTARIQAYWTLITSVQALVALGIIYMRPITICSDIIVVLFNQVYSFPPHHRGKKYFGHSQQMLYTKSIT